jgi:putative heme-binding domain-containing protein
LLESIFEPSKTIDPKFQAYIVETKAGRVHSGLLRKRTDEEVVLIDPGGKETRIPASEIELIASQRKSFMPELLLRDMTAQQVADMLAFLSTLKEPVPMSAAE